MKKGKIRIGTSGWSYDHWKGPFYPKDLPSQDFLSFYIKHFRTVEMNRTFYGLPNAKLFTGYAKKVPASFIFAIKAGRFITHIKRLKDPKPPLRRLFKRVSHLGKHLGPILFQLPQSMKIDYERLHQFLKVLPKGHRYTFEFRDASWFTDEIYDLLKKYRAAYCIYEFGSTHTPLIETANFIYVRLHGPKTVAYTGKYTNTALKKWAQFFYQESAKGKDVYCYFDNDQRGYATLNAKTLCELVKNNGKRQQ